MSGSLRWGVAVRSCAAVCVLVSIVLVPGWPARAATITVTTTADEAGSGSACSLREAILSANGNTAVGGCPAGSASSTDVIVLPAGTYTLSIVGTNEDAALDGDLDITESVQIQGAGDAVTVVDANGRMVGERVFEVFSPSVVMISGVTIRNGRGQSGAGLLINSANVTLTDTTVSDNDGRTGGGIDNVSGTLRLVHSRVSDNRAEFGEGGGIASTNGGTLSLTHSVVSGNVAFEGFGGGIDTTGGSTTLADSTVSGNDAVGDLGGGIFNSMNGTLTIDRSTISGNHAGTTGGGILDNVGSMTVTRSTVSGNTAEQNAAGIGSGNSTTSIVNSTISGNWAKGSGGGLESNGTPGVTVSDSTISGNIADEDGDGSGDGGGLLRVAGSIVLANTIVAGNVDSGGEAPDCTGDIGTQGFNLVGVNTSCIASPGQGDQLGTPASPIDPQLAPLADNGGPTATQALFPGSPAIDAGNPAQPGSGGSACAFADQRGVPRSVCDVGAYELAQCFGRPVTIVGTPKGETLTGTGRGDVILALAGNDVIESEGGDDRVCAGSGNDRVAGGRGDDQIAGNDGNDVLDGGPGNDLCIGGPGTDTVVNCERNRSP